MVSDRILYSKLVLMLAVATCAFMSGCDSAAQNQRPAEAPAPEVAVTEVQASDVPVISEYPAQTYARNTVEVRGRVDGYIDKWLFHPGQEVHAGDVLYVLDLRPYQAAVEQAKGNLAQSEADLEFARKQVALLQAEANLAASQANLRQSAAGLRSSETAGEGRSRRAAGTGRRRCGAARGRSQRASQPGQCGSDAAFNRDADFVHPGKDGSSARRAAHREAQSGLRHHSRAHQRVDRRYAGSGGRTGDCERRCSRSPPLFRSIPSGFASRSPSRAICRSRRIPRCSNRR